MRPLRLPTLPFRLWFVAGLVCLVPILQVSAGEIIIIQQAAPEGSRTDQEASRARNEARRQAGKAAINPGGGNIIIGDDAGAIDAPSRAEQSSQNARDYLRTPANTDATTGDGTVIILRAAPTSDAEKSRQRARSYVAPSNQAPRARECSNATSQVGTIGDGPNAERGNVVERGTSSVSSYCK